MSGKNQSNWTPEDNLMGITEIAKVMHISNNAVSNWTRRYGDFPKPIVRLASGPIYFWPTVERWLFITGRIQRTNHD